MPGTCQRLRLPSLTSLMRGGGAGGAMIGGTPHRGDYQASCSSHSSGSGSNNNHSQICKEKRRVVVMGAARVGKTCIISQFLYDSFRARYKQTVEELHLGEYELPDGSSLTLEILDTSGSYEFPAMRMLSINTAGAFILVYSVDDEGSWNEVERLRNQIISERGLKVPIVVVGNKLDINEQERKLHPQVIEMVVVEEWKCGYVECSAKDNVGIVEIFKELLVQANIRYNLSPAVRRRRQSLPAYSSPRRNKSPSHKYTMKRHSCTMT